jgi:DNA repair protein RadC
MPSTKIRELPVEERPREKLAKLGPGALTNAELVAIFLRVGVKGKSAVALAQELLSSRGSLQGLSRTTLTEMMRFAGVKVAKASQLCAAFELGRRLAEEQISGQPLDSPEKIFDFLGPGMRTRSQECVTLVLLDTRRCLIKTEEVSRGTVNESLAHPREILRIVLSHAPHSFVVVHNHPSGNPLPSSADREMTRRLARAAEAVGVPLADHVIIGAASVDGSPYFSFREAGLL